MGKLVYDQQTRDLAQLAANRVSDAMVSVLQLCDSPEQALQVSIMAAGSAMGSASGAVEARYGCTSAEARAVLLDLILNPITPAGQALSEGEQNG